jgi:hypothetical protein
MMPRRSRAGAIMIVIDGRLNRSAPRPAALSFLRIHFASEQLVCQVVGREENLDQLGSRGETEGVATGPLTTDNQPKSTQHADPTRDRGLRAVEGRDQIGLRPLPINEFPKDRSSDWITQRIEDPVGQRFCHLLSLRSQYVI